MSDPISQLCAQMHGVDHLAIAVEDLDAAVAYYTQLGFAEQERRVTRGRTTGMESVVLSGGGLKVVLLKGTSEESQVTRYIRRYGPGVQHVAFRVQDIGAVVADLIQRGVAFDTGILTAPGLKQAFTARDPVSGMMFELIERTGEAGFSDQNVQKLFESLEEKDSF